MSDDDLARLIAQVLAWQDGEDRIHCGKAATHRHYLDHAQQCMEDMREWGIWSAP